MWKKALGTCAIVVFAGSLTVFAGDAGSGSGHFTNHFSDVMVAEMADGSMVQTLHYSNISMADDPHNPSANVAHDCVGQLRMNAKGEVTSGSGMCFGTAPDGHGFSHWWQVEEAGTADCPQLCGTWGYFGGYGRFAGLEGTGTWETTATFGESASMGTWTNSYSMP